MRRGNRSYLSLNDTAEELDALCSEQPSARSRLSRHSTSEKPGRVSGDQECSCACTVFTATILDAVQEGVIWLADLQGSSHMVYHRSRTVVMPDMVSHN